MCAYVVGVVRSATRLDALTYDSSEPADAAHPWRWTHGYGLQPLAASARPELSAAWSRLEAVSRWDASTLADVLLVLRETVPSLDTPADLAVLGEEVHPSPPPRATAAHPRAFRGTRSRPPRPPRPSPIDLRSHLLTRRHSDRVFEQLGYAQRGDPYLVWNHGTDIAPALDRSFVTYLLPLWRGCSGGTLGAAATLAQALELTGAPSLRAALVGLYLAAGDPIRALSWWSHVLAHPPVQRLDVAQVIVATGVAKLEPFGADVAAAVAGLDLEQQWSFYRALALGASTQYLLSGVEVGAIPPGKIAELPPGQTNVASIVGVAVGHIGEAFAEDSGVAFWHPHLWHLCGQLAGFSELLSSPAFLALEPTAAFWLVRLASLTRWNPETSEREWRDLAPKLPQFSELAGRVSPSYQRKLIEQMGDVCSWATDNEGDVTDAVDKCVDLSLRVAKPPFGTEAVLGSLLPSLALFYKGEASDRKAMCDAPDSSWLALETACKRTNQVRTIGRGLNRLARVIPKLLVSTFASNPGALIETADRLSSLSQEAAEAILAAQKALPLFAPNAGDAPLGQLCEVVDPIVRAGGPNPIRRALRQHLAGERALSNEQLHAHRERIVAELGSIRLAALRQAVDRVLAARVGIEKIETPTVRHAAAILEGVEVHRRQLRRMLSAWLAGDRDWRLRHPRTREWLARHPRLHRVSWLTGVSMRIAAGGLGDVEITLEADPLEALKLGTYVGSCLGRGGNFEYAAAAVVLDVNKQVIYARDERGAVIGRQLVAIAESDELVCFSVYGAARREIEPAFREYDQVLAAKVGIPLFERSDRCSTDYDIARVLSHDWWDDTAWNPIE